MLTFLTTYAKKEYVPLHHPSVKEFSGTTRSNTDRLYISIIYVTNSSNHYEIGARHEILKVEMYTAKLPTFSG